MFIRGCCFLHSCSFIPSTEFLLLSVTFIHCIPGDLVPAFELGWGCISPTNVGRSQMGNGDADSDCRGSGPGLEWPVLEPSVLSFIRRHFVSPLHLQAAFDDEQDCIDLIKVEFPDIIDETLRDQAASLMLWQSSLAPAFKRARRTCVSDLSSKLRSPEIFTLHDKYRDLLQTNSSVVLEMLAKKRQRKYKDEAPDARARRFESERRKYALPLAGVIKQARLPIAPIIEALDDPVAGWVHLFAARRSNTLKARFQTWRPFQRWLELHTGKLFPDSVKDAINYMQSRVDDDCGKTVPESFHITLNLIETLGRVPEDEQISRDPLWLGHVKSWTAELSADSPPRRPAEMYTVAMLISLEVLVAAEAEPIFMRALAWVVLVMVWASLRCDDVQAILPHRMSLTNYGLRLVLGKTKTTGPDKPQKEVMAFVHRTVSLTGIDWLATGFEIWESDTFNFRRDYLVMEPTSNWEGYAENLSNHPIFLH